MRGPVVLGYDKYVVLVKISAEGNLEQVQIFRLVEKNKWQKCPTQKVKHQSKTLMRLGEKCIKVYGFQEMKLIVSLDDNFVKSLRVLYDGVQITPTIRNDEERFIKML